MSVQRLTYVTVLGLLALVVGLTQPGDVEAHNPTQISASLKYMCLSPNTGSSVVHYSGQGPTNRSWTIVFRVMNAGDQYQSVYLNARVNDNANGAEVGRLRHALSNWIDPGSEYIGTMSPHVGSSFSMNSDMLNFDSTSHCFWHFVTAGYE